MKNIQFYVSVFIDYTKYLYCFILVETPAFTSSEEEEEECSVILEENHKSSTYIWSSKSN